MKSGNSYQDENIPLYQVPLCETGTAALCLSQFHLEFPAHASLGIFSLSLCCGLTPAGDETPHPLTHFSPVGWGRESEA